MITVSRADLYKVLKAFSCGYEETMYLLDTLHKEDNPIRVLTGEFNENYNLLKKTGGRLRLIKNQD